MKKILTLIASSVFASTLYAEIPYCSGTSLTGAKSDALQLVVAQFASENKCIIGDNCILNFDKIKYSIAWAQDCEDSAQKGNDAKGSTFVCASGVCHPLGFYSPHAAYNSLNKAKD